MVGMGPAPAGMAGGAGRHQDVLAAAQKKVPLWLLDLWVLMERCRCGTRRDGEPGGPGLTEGAGARHAEGMLPASRGLPKAFCLRSCSGRWIYSACASSNVFGARRRKPRSFPGISHVQGLLEPCERGNIPQIKNGKNHVSLLGVGFSLPISPLKLELLWQGKVSARCAGHPTAR